MITLKCSASTGSAAFHAEMIEGIQVPSRRYAITDNEIRLDGFDEIILQHDAQELLNMPDGLYRMPTPAEQDVATEVKRASVTVSESAPAKKNVG